MRTESLRNTAIQKLVQSGIKIELAPFVTDIVIEVFAENPETPIESRILCNGPLKIDTLMRCAYWNEEKVPFSPRELKLVEYFMRHIDRVMPVKSTLKDVWGPAHTDSTYIQYVRVFAAQINKKVPTKIIINRFAEGYYMPIMEVGEA